jgi:hypothetical protein
MGVAFCMPLSCELRYHLAPHVRQYHVRCPV